MHGWLLPPSCLRLLLRGRAAAKTTDPSPAAGCAILGGVLLLAWLAMVWSVSSRFSTSSRAGSSSSTAAAPSAWLLDALLAYGGAQAAAGVACSWLLSGRPLLWLLLWEAWLAAVAGMGWSRPELLQRPLVLLLLAYAAPCVVALAPLELWSWLVRAVCAVALLLGLATWCWADRAGHGGRAVQLSKPAASTAAALAAAAACKAKQM